MIAFFVFNTQVWGNAIDTIDDLFIDETYYEVDTDYEEETYNISPDTTTIIQPPSIDQTKWNKLTNDPDFNYEIPEKTLSGNWLSDVIGNLIEFLTTGGKWIIWVLLTVLLIIIIWFIEKRIQHKNKRLYDDTYNDDMLRTSAFQNIDYNSLIQEALSKKDLESATILMYQHILQQLQKNEDLHITPDTTNYVVLQKTKQFSWHTSLLPLIRTFEKVAFGNYSYSQEDFKNYQNHYKNIISSLH